MKPSQPNPVEQLLRSLNEWAALRQTEPGGVPLDDTGEIGGRIHALIEELARAGQRVELRDGRYVLQAQTGSPP